MNIIFILLIGAVAVSGFFDVIPWAFNIPAILVLVVVWLVSIYNSLVTVRNHVQEAWSDIEVQMKRRFDLIPNLVNTVKGSTNFETSTLEKVINARSKAMEAGSSPAKVGEADLVMKSALAGFFALAESYPDLKSNQNFIALQNELSDTENKIQSARRFYNGVVKEYNTTLQVVPTNVFAKLFSFKESEFFELGADEQVAKNPVEVKF